MRLATKICSMKAMIPDPCNVVIDSTQENEAFLRSRIAKEAQAVELSPHFIFDNVSEHYGTHFGDNVDIEDDIPNFAPPFKSFFAEWSVANAILKTVEPNKRPVAHYEGVLVYAADVKDGEINRENFADFLFGAVGYGDRLSKDDHETYLSCLELSRWVLFCSWWTTSNSKPLFGRPLWLGTTSILFINEEYRCFRYFHSGITDVEKVFGPKASALSGPCRILGLGISFCHCKNVRRSEKEIVGMQLHKGHKPPRLKFYTLEINPMREFLRTEGRSEETGLKRALHICRGHFATYSPDHPLFGKYVGTFWRPDHVRGSQEAGEVHKNYSVKTSEGKS